MNREEKAEGRKRKAARAIRLLPSAYCLLPSIFWALAAALTLMFVSMVVVAPVALARGQDFTAVVIYRSFARLCHQIPERSFFIDGHPLAVCARCTGIYFGFAAGTLFYPLLRSLKNSRPPARKWLLAALVPALIDFTLGFFGIWENTHLTRSLTGALLGVVAALFVVPGLLDLGRMISVRVAGAARAQGSESVVSPEI